MSDANSSKNQIISATVGGKQKTVKYTDPITKKTTTEPNYNIMAAIRDEHLVDEDAIDLRAEGRENKKFEGYKTSINKYSVAGLGMNFKKYLHWTCGVKK